MKSTNRTWRTATMTAVGAGGLVLGGTILPAAAAPSDLTLVEPGSDVKTVAQQLDLAAGEVKKLVENDLAVVTEGGYLYYTDKWDIHDHDHPESHADSADVPGNPAEGSRPDAPVTVYLDFDGETVTDTQWNLEFDLGTIEAAPASAADENFQRQVWELVAEDYAPFNVNVTTTRPSDDKLYKTSQDDAEYGSHVVITDSYEELPFAAGSGGVAFLGGTGARFLSPAWVFTTGVSAEGNPATVDAKAVADAAAHEVGHNFGLGHDGIGDQEYYAPLTGQWGPIMGAPYSVPLTQWSNGDYAGATNDEDDLSVITDRSAVTVVPILKTEDGELYFGPYCTTGDPNNPQPSDEYYLPNEDGGCNPPGAPLTPAFEYTDRADSIGDDAGNDAGSAKGVDNAEGSFSVDGVISATDDVDVYSVATAGGPITAEVAVAANSANLDASLTLTDAQGNEVAASSPDDGLGASVEAEVEAGTYYLSIDGVGNGSGDSSTPEQASGYSDYGSLGNYTLSGEAEPFQADAITITAPQDGAEVQAGEIEVTGVATPGAAVAVTANGEAGAEATAGDDGAWTASLEVGYGKTTIEAAQTVDGIAVPETASVTVTVPVDAPVVTQPEDGATSSSPTPTFAGTALPGAEVEVAIVAAGAAEDAEPVVRTTVEADDEGNWEFVPEKGLDNGDYEFAAVQTVNGVTSDPSEVVNFSVDVSGDGGEGGSEDGGDGGDAGGSDDGDDGGLPDTGSSSLGLLLAAAALVVLGGGAAWMARVRRSTV